MGVPTETVRFQSSKQGTPFQGVCILFFCGSILYPAQVPFARFRCVRAAAKDRRGAAGWVPAPFLHRHHAVAVRLPFERPGAQTPYCVAPFAFGPMFGIKHSSLVPRIFAPVYL